VPQTPAVAADVVAATPPATSRSTPPTPRRSTPWSPCLNEAHPRHDGRAWTAADTLKNVVVMLVLPDGSRDAARHRRPRRPRGRREAPRCPGRAARVDGFEEDDFANYPTLGQGLHRPRRARAELAEVDRRIRYLLDPRVADGTAWITGADISGKHVFDLVKGRDFEGDGTIEAAEVRDGDACPSCGHGLESARGIEMGHIFQLGTKYAEALDLKVLDENGKLRTVTMGSYGVGVSRAVACVAEGNHDELGLIWPRALAPADVHVVVTGKDETVATYGEELTRALEARGVAVLLDDRRQASPGVKFKDAELIGVPTIVVIGPRSCRTHGGRSAMWLQTGPLRWRLAMPPWTPARSRASMPPAVVSPAPLRSARPTGKRP
jgi:prolyl-tRNA synthetase